MRIQLDTGEPAPRNVTNSQRLEQDSKRAQAIWRQGRAHVGLGRYEEAVRDFDRALALQPYLQHALFWRGLAYLNLGQHAKSIEDLRRSLELRPNDDWACQHQAWNYVAAPVELRDATRAKQLALRAIYVGRKKNRSISIYQATLAMAHYRLNEHQRALDIFDQLPKSKLGSFAPAAIFFRAMCHYQLGDKDKARACYDEASTLVEHDTRTGFGDVELIRIEAGQQLGIISP